MTAPRLPRAVLFDLDGTLVDSAPDLIHAINRVRADHGRSALPLAALRPMVSKGGRAMLAVAFPDLSADQRESLLHNESTPVATFSLLASDPAQICTPEFKNTYVVAAA